MKDNKGITLIALVITIIVLLILAGITIAMLTGDNGLLTRAQNSANDNAIAGAKDIVSMEVQNGVTEYLQKYYSVVDSSAREALDLQTLVEDEVPATANGCTVDVAADHGKITITKDNRKCQGTVTYTAGTGSSVGSYTIKWGSMENV